jgi:hypothetical protein
MDTLKSLFDGASISDSYGIIIYIGDVNTTYIQSVGDEIIKKYPKEMKKGRIEIIGPPVDYYPDFEGDIKNSIETNRFFNTFGDNASRIKWRQKQNLGKF